jgi:hypothetical protein
MDAYVTSKSLRVSSAGALAAALMSLAGCGSTSNPNTDGVGSSGSSSGSSQGSMSGGSSGSSSSGAGSSNGAGSSSGSSSGTTETGGDGGGDSGASPSEPSDGGTVDGTMTPESGESNPPHADLGKGDGSDVILLGDSWMSNTLQIEGTGGGIAPALQQVSMQPYRNYAVQGVMMLQADAFGPAIPTQYPAAKMANPDIKTVVMTGGGNDIIQGSSALQADCKMGGAMCKMTLDQIGDALNTLWTQMATDGVQDIVFVNYSTDVGTVAPSLRGDGGVPTPMICTTGKIRCWEYDSTAAVMKQIAADGIHPVAAANQRMATEIYALMTQEGMRR